MFRLNFYFLRDSKSTIKSRKLYTNGIEKIQYFVFPSRALHCFVCNFYISQHRLRLLIEHESCTPPNLPFNSAAHSTCSLSKCCSESELYRVAFVLCIFCIEKTNNNFINNIFFITLHKKSISNMTRKVLITVPYTNKQKGSSR